MDQTPAKPCGVTVLVVEDDDMIRETLNEALRLEGFDVVTAENGQVALEKLAEIPHPCLILLDLMMPVMNGWQFLERRQRNDVLMTIPVALFTAATNPSISRAVGVQSVLKKPLDIDTLIKAVKRYCDILTKAVA